MKTADPLPQPRTRPHRVHWTRLGALAGVLIVGLCASIADAGITGTAGAVTVIGRPQGTLASDSIESDTTVYAWFERTIKNPGAQSLDHVGAGLVTSNNPLAFFPANPQTVTPTLADSYIVHFDQAGAGNATISNASITFSRAIIGVWHTTTGLGGGDAQWAPPGLTYGFLSARQYELGTGTTQDRYQISADLRTITIVNSYTQSNGVDQLRILVSPEPTTLALTGLGLLGLGGIVLRRRRQRQRQR